MNLLILLQLIAGLGLLVGGAELLVKGASRIAVSRGISSLVVGLTIVAFGTSSPELAVSLQSAFSNQADISLGNVIGSNILNILLILGISALISPLNIARQLLRFDVPIMIGVSVLTLILSQDGKLGRPDGILLFSGAIIYTSLLLKSSRQENIAPNGDLNRDTTISSEHRFLSPTLIDVGMIILGIGLLVIGSTLLINSAIAIAVTLGVSELVIGLTIIAGGTSLPELASSVVASWQGEQDISVGNVIGSNIFNLLVVLGLTATLAPEGIRVSPAVLSLDLPLMIAVAIACFPIFLTGKKIARWEGLIFVAYYIAYTTFLILKSADHDQLPLFSSVVLLFVIPITLVTMGISIMSHFQKKA